MCASPQKENGYTAIANELLEKLYSAHLNGSELAMCLMVLRKTYGFRKKEDWISLSQFEQGLGISHKMVCKSKKKLVYYRILLTDKNKVKFNKNYEDWLVYYNTLPPVYCSTPSSVLSGTETVYCSTHTKENTKEINTKELNLLKKKLKSKHIIKRI